MKILIVGGSGQVGWELQRALAPLGELIATSRTTLNLGNVEAIEQALAQWSPDVVVNAAAYTAVDQAEAHPDAADAINHRAVAAMAHYAARTRSWLVHYSSDYVYDGSGTSPFAENHATAPINVYGASKLAGDRAIAASGCCHLILRTSWVHAPRGTNFVRTMLRLAAERESIEVVSDQHGAPTSAELIADVTAIALQRAMADGSLSGTYHLAASGETSWFEIAAHAVKWARQHGTTGKLDPDAIRPIQSANYPTPARRPLNSRLDTTKLQRTFGVELPPWQAGVERTLAGLVAA